MLSGFDAQLHASVVGLASLDVNVPVKPNDVDAPAASEPLYDSFVADTPSPLCV
jgi:hypothetical protein